jgi:hypothetical protein
MGMIFAVAKHLCSMLRRAAVSATAMSRHRPMIQPSELLRMRAQGSLHAAKSLASRCAAS